MPGEPPRANTCMYTYIAAIHAPVEPDHLEDPISTTGPRVTGEGLAPGTRTRWNVRALPA